MSFWDVSVIVDGALDKSEAVETEPELVRLVEAAHAEAEADGLETEVYVLFHGHSMFEADGEVEECECAQYVTDHHPDYAWNVAE